jgi:hypothetical protein
MKYKNIKEHLHDIISPRGKVWVHKTTSRLTLPLFIEVSAPS